MFSHISGTSSKGSCTAWKWAGKGSLLLTLLLKEICRGLDVQGSHSQQPGASCPTSHQWSLLLPLAPSQAGGGRLGKPRSTGQRDTGMQHRCSLLRGRRGAGGGRALPVAWQLPCKSPSCQKTFFPAIWMGFHRHRFG